MRASVLIQEVSRDLNDQEPGYEYLTWPKEQLRSYLLEAVTQLAVLFRKLFLVQRTVQVKPGGLWQKAGCCDQILRVVGEVTEDGEQLLRYLSNVTDDTRSVWPGEVTRCSQNPDSYEMTGYSINNLDDSLFKVYPPVPRGGQPRYVLVECLDSPSSVADDYDVPMRLVALVKQWMLARAYAVDSENNQSVMQISENHKQTYFRLLDLELAAAKREEAEHGDLRTISNDAAGEIPQ